MHLAVLGQGHPLHTGGELKIPSPGAQGSVGTLAECLGAGSRNMKVSVKRSSCSGIKVMLSLIKIISK